MERQCGACMCYDTRCVLQPAGPWQRDQRPGGCEQEEQPCSLQGQQADTPPPGLPGGQQQDADDRLHQPN